MSLQRAALRHDGMIKITIHHTCHLQSLRQVPATLIGLNGDRDNLRRDGIGPTPGEARCSRRAGKAHPPIIVAETPTDLDFIFNRRLGGTWFEPAKAETCTIGAALNGPETIAIALELTICRSSPASIQRRSTSHSVSIIYSAAVQHGPRDR